MAIEWFVGNVQEFAGENRKIVARAGKEIAIFAFRGKFYAFENECLHMGGPVGEGLIIGKVEAVLDENKCLVREEFSETEIHLVCPWHGWEYDIETGAFAGNRRRKLRRYEAFERGGRVYVRS